MKDLFLITCLAQYLSESERINTEESFDLADWIEEAADLFMIAHGESEVKAKELVKQIRKIWRENDGCWPDEYRY